MSKSSRYVWDTWEDNQSPNKSKSKSKTSDELLPLPKSFSSLEMNDMNDDDNDLVTIETYFSKIKSPSKSSSKDGSSSSSSDYLTNNNNSSELVESSASSSLTKAITDLKEKIASMQTELKELNAKAKDSQAELVRLRMVKERKIERCRKNWNLKFSTLKDENLRSLSKQKEFLGKVKTDVKNLNTKV